MWIHVPSFLVGSLVSGSGFLFVHQQLSHRSRLSKKWPLREYAEHEFQTMWAQMRPSQGKNDASMVANPSNPIIDGWNKGVTKVQQALKKQDD